MVTDHRLNTTTNNEHGNVKPLTKDDIITKLRAADVLLGRGSSIVNYEGNVAFRLVIKIRKAEYTASYQHKEKDRVAREILAHIQDQGGRFLRRIDPMELARLNLSLEQKSVWAAVDEDIAIEKVKQALRDKDQWKNKCRAKEAMFMMHQQQQQQQEQQPRVLRAVVPAANLLSSDETKAFQQNLLLHQFMDQQNTDDMMVLIHLQQQMQRKQLIQDLFLDQQQRGVVGSVLSSLGSNVYATFNNDLKTLIPSLQPSQTILDGVASYSSSNNNSNEPAAHVFQYRY